MSPSNVCRLVHTKQKPDVATGCYDTSRHGRTVDQLGRDYLGSPRRTPNSQLQQHRHVLSKLLTGDEIPGDGVSFSGELAIQDIESKLFSQRSRRKNMVAQLCPNFDRSDFQVMPKTKSPLHRSQKRSLAEGARGPESLYPVG